jgi:tRNA 2-thiocytidine biosynthesis protein TtcA
MRRSKTEYFTAKKVGRAINRFDMISDGDDVIVGVSGGKDSLALLTLLHRRRRWVPVDYGIKALYVSTDYDTSAESTKRRLRGYFEELGCEYEFRDIAIKDKNKKNRPDCFWCSWNRRKAIFRAAEEMGCAKVALGHHKDDAAETILMNLIYNGAISGINPVQELFEGRISIIRPMILLAEKEIARYAGDAGLPVVRSACPMEKRSKRDMVKRVLGVLSRDARVDIKKNIIRGPSRIKTDYIPDLWG